jgi:tRNA-binding EMAP/Myf-like protein
LVVSGICLSDQSQVGRVVEIARHPDSVKLYVTKIDFGTETRQVVTGLVPYAGGLGMQFSPMLTIVVMPRYYAEASMLHGRLVVAVVNLKAVKLAKTDSQVCRPSVFDRSTDAR